MTAQFSRFIQQAGDREDLGPPDETLKTEVPLNIRWWKNDPSPLKDICANHIIVFVSTVMLHERETFQS